MTLPQFLIVGAMKAGTTSLYAMLCQVPGLYLPPEKEPGDLLHGGVETPEGLAAYARKFAAAPTGALCGEATTAYAKRPGHEGIADRARRVLGPDLRVIYMVRDPYTRALSQYSHLVALGLETRPADIALRADPSYADFSRYAWQIAPWQKAFGPHQVLVLSLERMTADPQGALDRTCAFLGVPSVTTRTEHRNASAGRRVTLPGSVGRRIMEAPLYRYGVKPLLPGGVHRLGKRMLLTATPTAKIAVSAETETLLARVFADDPLACAARDWAVTR